MHVTEPQDDEKNVLSDAVYWQDDLLAEAYMFGRGLGNMRPAAALADCELIVLDFDELLAVLRDRDVIKEDGDREVIYISDLGNAFSPDEIREELDSALCEVTIQEAYELGAIFAYNKESRKLAWLYPDQYVTETRISDILGGNRAALEKYPRFKEGLALFDQVFEQ
ncbi:hypothetical protein [Natronoglomus mannanivorans]|uniref:Uncharacterized protein n=1 Tax=Natronoglomus mannanivorans TaxID=2979990 RepID=A0AAP2Z3M4_9EURY|nr:hypothetical protein [Halobacteria archaeon AArc-xg1-1]